MLYMLCSMYSGSMLWKPPQDLPAGRKPAQPPQPISTSLLPSPVLTLGAPNLPLLKQTLSPPLTPLRVHIPRRLHRNASPGSLCRNLLPTATFQLRHLDVLPRVELKRRLRAQDLEVQFRGRMRHADQSPQGQVARVERDYIGRVQDEAVVEGRGGGAEEEGCVWLWGRGVSGDFSGGDGVGVEGEMLVG